MLIAQAEEGAKVEKSIENENTVTKYLNHGLISLIRWKKYKKKQSNIKKREARSKTAGGILLIPPAFLFIRLPGCGSKAGLFVARFTVCFYGFIFKSG